MSKKFGFEIVKKNETMPLARVGIISTPHGDINTPAFIPVGTKATVKTLSPEQLLSIGAQSVLANTYHLYLQPGAALVESHGGFAKMMNVNNDERQMPTWTDSGGFQVFSLGAAFGTGVSKIATSKDISEKKQKEILDSEGHTKIKTTGKQMAKIDEDGVTFKSIIDGSKHRFTPEISMQIQHALGADIFFAFDECTSPLASHEYQVSAMGRTHRWAQRCIGEHTRLGVSGATGEQQALFAVVQGGAFTDLRKESAEFLASLPFDGFGIGGSFTKEDMGVTVKSATENLPEGKPRHLLGIGEPIDFFLGVEYGIDTFDCVSPTRVARNGAFYTPTGRKNIKRSEYKKDMSLLGDGQIFASPVDHYTKSYIHHLFRADEVFGLTILSIHNLNFIIKLVEEIRQSLLGDTFFEFKKSFCDNYYGQGKW
jgi:queuine tRNA-ribosyltransferase